MEPVKTFYIDGCEYQVNGIPHREDGPSFISKYKNGNEFHLYGRYLNIIPQNYKQSLAHIHYLRLQHGAG